MEKWCKTCRTWFPVSEGCLVCGYEGEKFNKTLMTAKLNSHLFGQAERVHKETTDQGHFLREAKKEQRRFVGS